MNFIQKSIPEIILIKSKLVIDSRGHFIETFRKDLLEKTVGFQIDFCQENQSKSFKGVLRGLHFQLPPFAQSKLVSVIKGEILDISVDIRLGSPTFGKYVSVKLNDINKYQLFIPRGFAHGFVVLSDFAIVSYKVDNYYSKKKEVGLSYKDPFLGINWKLSKNQLTLSNKDLKNPFLKDLQKECSSFDYNKNFYE